MRWGSCPRWLCIVVGIGAAAVSLAEGGAKPLGTVKRVLVIHTLSPNHPWIEPFDRAIRAATTGMDPPADIYVEHIDQPRFKTAEHLRQFFAYLEQKYAALPPDVIVANGLIAGSMVIDWRERVAPGKPLVVIGPAQGGALAEKVRRNDTVFVSFGLPFDENFQLIHDWLPQTKRVLIVGMLTTPLGRPLLDASIERTARKLFAEVRYLEDARVDSVVAEIAKLPPDSAVFGYGFLQDASGATLSAPLSAKQLSSAGSVPSIAPYDSMLGAGVVGGLMANGASQGEAAAMLLRRLLRGEAIAALPRQVAAEPRYFFDYAALRRFGLDDRPLPPGSVVINRPASLYDTHPGAVSAAAAVIALLFVVVVALIVVARVRQRAAAALAAANASLEQRVEQRSLELQQAMGQLVQNEKLAALGNLVAGVAHELNTPLGNALTVATTLQAHGRELASAVAGGQLKRAQLDGYLQNTDKACEIVERNLGRAAELVASFKQVAVDQSSMRRRRFDLRETVDETLRTITPGFKKKPVRISNEVAPDIVCDSYPGPLEQVVTNLVENAVIHGLTDGGQLHIRIGATPDASDEHVVLTVADDGKGIAADVQQRIFDPFFTTRLGQGGSGLGLYLVHTLVRGALGGALHVESAPDRGTTFHITIPLRAPEHAANVTA